MEYKHARYMSEKEIEEMLKNFNPEEKDPAEIERDAYFGDPANAKEIAEQQARMDLVIALYNARKAANLTQKELAERLGTKQTYIAQIERGRKNITWATLTKYAAACGKRVTISLL